MTAAKGLLLAHQTWHTHIPVSHPQAHLATISRNHSYTVLQEQDLHSSRMIAGVKNMQDTKFQGKSYEILCTLLVSRILHLYVA